MAADNLIAPNPPAASVPAAPARIVSDIENHLLELRAGLGVLRAVACDDTPQLDGVELTWLAHRLLDTCEVVEGHVARLRDALCPASVPVAGNADA